MHTPDVILLKRQKKTSFQTNLGNDSLAAADMYEAGHLVGTVEVNHAASGSLGEEMGEQNPAPPGWRPERREVRSERVGMTVWKEFLIKSEYVKKVYLTPSSCSVLPAFMGRGEVGSVSRPDSFYDPRHIH